MNVYIARDGQTHGPYTESETRARLAAGALLPDDLAWTEGSGEEWRPLCEALPAPASPPPPAGLPDLRHTPSAIRARRRQEIEEEEVRRSIRARRRGGFVENLGGFLFIAGCALVYFNGGTRLEYTNPDLFGSCGLMISAGLALFLIGWAIKPGKPRRGE